MQPELTTPILLSLNFHADTVRTSVMSATFQENPSEKENQESKGAELTEANSDQSKVSQDLSKQTGPTHVTIQLPESMQGTSISQQKMQELIAHLSQSGQLNDDGKIIIQVKGSLEKPEERSQSSEKNSDADQEHQMPPPQPVSSAPSIKPSPHQVSSHAIRYVTVQQAPSSSVFSTSTPKTAFIRTTTGPSQVKVDVLQSQSNSAQGQGDIKTQGAATAYQVLSANGGGGGGGQQLQQTGHSQQPAYILIPANQQTQHLSVTPLNTTTSMASSASTPIRVVNQAGQHIIFQHANTTPMTSTPISSFSLKTASMLKDGERSVVVLQQQHQNPIPIVPVRSFAQQHNNRLPPAPPAIAAAATSATFSPSPSTPSVRVSRGSSLGTSGKESSWQQYVKQFEKLGPCPICGDKISGYHYGIFCCESCKGFFKRTVQNAKRYACHMATPSSLCDITATSRKKCPACRFVKCLEKGMRMEAIRTDRTRGGRSMYPGSRYLRQLAARASGGGEVKCELKCTPSSSAGASAALPAIAPLPNSAAAATAAAAASGGSFPKIEGVNIMSLGGVGGGVTYELPASEDVGGGVYLDPAVLEDTGGSGTATSAAFQADTVYRLPIQTHETLDMPKLLRDIIKVEESVEAEPEERLDFESPEAGQSGNGALPPSVTEEEAAVYRALLNLADQRLYRIVRWSRALPVFSNLDTDDQILLLQNCWADLLCLDCCWKSLPTPTEIRLTSTKCINLDAAREMGAEGLVDSLLRLTQDLKRLRFGLIDFACLKVFLLMQSDLANLKAVDQVKRFQDCVSEMLMEFNASTFSDVPNKYTELLIRIPELQRTSAMARDLLIDKDLSPYLSANSLLMELLRSDFHRHPSTMMPPSTSVGSVTVDTGGRATASFPETQHRGEESVDERHRVVFQAGEAMDTSANSYPSNGPL
uniref:Nuclear receptor domain-containing protein n=1 Tax=Mesocestoides corti TaxID=53468 RepID=A0A5K3FQI5_MESCO